MERSIERSAMQTSSAIDMSTHARRFCVSIKRAYVYINVCMERKTPPTRLDSTRLIGRLTSRVPLAYFLFFLVVVCPEVGAIGSKDIRILYIYILYSQSPAAHDGGRGERRGDAESATSKGEEGDGKMAVFFSSSSFFFFSLLMNTR